MPAVQSEQEGPTPARLRYRILQAGSWVASGFVVDKLIAAAQLVILARLLTPADFGLMAASAVVLVALLTVSEVGIEPSLVVRRGVTDVDLAVAWTLSIGRALILAVCLLLFADAIASFFKMPELGALLRVHALALLIQGAQSPALALLLRDLNLGRRVQLELIRRVIEATATIALAFWLRSAWALLIGQLTGLLASAMVSYYVAPFCPRFSLHRGALGKFTHYGKHLNLTTILTFGVTSGGAFVIGRMLGSEALGLYQVALTLPMLLGVRAALMLNQVSFPTYAILQKDRDGIVRAFAIQMVIVGLTLVPVAAGLAIAVNDLVAIMFGPGWVKTAEPLRILCLFAVCASFSGVMASLHYGLNRPDLQTRVWGVQFAIYAATLIPLTAWNGLIGAAISLTLSYSVGVVLNVLYTVRLIGVDAWASFAAVGRVMVSVVGIGAAMILALKLLGEPTGAWGFAVVGVPAAVLYTLYLWRVEYPRLLGLWKGQPFDQDPSMGSKPLSSHG